jgi:hypothetical protein
LFDVAVGRARRVGRGGVISHAHYSSLLTHEAHGLFAYVKFYRDYRDGETGWVYVLIPGLADVRRFLSVLEKLESRLNEMLWAEGRGNETYRVKPELLPLGVQIALKKVVDAIVAVSLNAGEHRGIERYVGSLLVTCDPRAVEVRVEVDKWLSRTDYNIFYFCKSPVHDKHELWLTFRVHRDRVGKPLEFDIGIHQLR